MASDTAEGQGRSSITGETLYEAEFDPKFMPYATWLVSLYLTISVAGVILIPFWLIISRWYCPEYMRRISARVTTSAVEIRQGVFFRKETTIPLNRITDVRLHDGPLMRYHGLRGLEIETAGQAGPQAGSTGNLIGVIDALEMRNLILVQRQKAMGAVTTTETSATVAGSDNILVEIRDILARIEGRLGSGTSD